MSASVQAKFTKAGQYVEFALKMHKNAQKHGGRKVKETEYKHILLWCEDLKNIGYPEPACFKLISDFPKDFARFIRGNYSKNEANVNKFIKNYKSNA